MAAKYTDVITTNSGTTLPGATVQLFDGSGALVTTYTDDALTQNPATSRTADDNGIVELYVADGTYTVRQTYGSVTRDLANVELYDISTIASTSSGAVANKAQAAAIGISGSAENIGTFTGSTISDNGTAKAGMQELETAVETKANASAVGVTSSAANMGTYTGTTIPDNETAKQNIQSLETAVETKANASAVGVTSSASNMGTYTGSTISDNQTAKQNIQELETAVEARVSTAALAAASGVFLVGNAVQYRSSRANLAAQTNTSLPALLTESSREGTFVWSSANNSANVTADPQQGVYVAPASDTTGASGAWVRKYFGAVNVKWFGATGDGATDDYTAIAAARTFLASGGHLYFPFGTYKTSLEVNFDYDNITISGDGPRSSIVTTSSGTAHILSFGNGTTARNGITVKDIGFNATGAKSAGSSIRLNKVNQASVSNYWIGSPFIGIEVLSSTIVFIERGQIANPTVTTGQGIYIGGTTGNDQYISDTIITGDSGNQPLAGVRIQHSGGVWLDNVGAIWSGDGLLIDPANGQEVLNLFTSRCAWDTNSKNGAKAIPAAGAAIRRWTSTGDWFATNTLAGFTTGGAGSVSGVTFNGPRAYNNGTHGMAFTSAANGIDIVNPRISGNSVTSSNTSDGINFAAGVSNWSVIGGKIGQQDGFTDIQRYGISVETGASDNYSIIGCDVLTNLSGRINDGGSGATKTIYGNPGYKTSNSGGATIAVGNSSIAVTHNLSATPTVNDIQVTPLSNLGGSGVTYFWISAATSTTFTISVNTSVATVGINFSWAARVKGA